MVICLKMKDDRKLTCKICGCGKAIVRKYDLNVCRRCFKDHAEELGFHKY